MNLRDSTGDSSGAVDRAAKMINKEYKLMPTK